jgi:hypothetical protein
MMISRRRSFRMIGVSVLLIMALVWIDTSVSAHGLKGSGRTTTMQNTDSMNDTGEVEQIHRFLFIQDAITDFFKQNRRSYWVSCHDYDHVSMDYYVFSYLFTSWR